MSLGSINPTNNRGETPLHQAAKNDEREIARYILKNKYVEDKNPPDFVQNRTPLHYAALNGHFEFYRFMIKYVPHVNPPISQVCTTPLHLAALNCHCSVVNFITAKALELDLDPNPPDAQGYTPLHFAAMKCDFHSVKALVSMLKPAEMDVRNEGGYAPLHCAAEGGSLNVVKYLFHRVGNKDPRTDMGCTVAHQAAHFNRMTILKFLHQNKVNVMARNRNGDTPMHYAARRGQVEAMQFFLSVSEDKSPKNHEDNTPFHIAVSYESQFDYKDAWQTSLFLCKHLPLDMLNSINKDGKSALYYTIENYRNLGLFKAMQKVIDERKNPRMYTKPLMPYY